MNRVIKILICFFILINLPNLILATEETMLTSNILQSEPQTIVTKAKIIKAGEVHDEVIGELTNKIQNVKVKVLEGDYKGQEFDTIFVLSYDMDNKILAYELNKGDTVFFQIILNDGKVTQTVVQDVVRQNYIIWMLVVFFILILAVGKKQGLKAIIAFVITILLIFFITIKLIFNGYSPILSSILTSIIIIIITFIIIAGINKKSITAAIGTTGGIICSGIMALIFGILAKLSGGAEESIYLSIASENVLFNFRELLFAGIIISSLGACMDVGMSIASSLDELKQKKPDISWKELLKSGMNIGGDVIGTMTNTLILAYIGGALNLVLLFMANNMSISDILNKETIATDAISAIAASMGVIFTVPITSITYSLLNRKQEKPSKKIGKRINGNRSMKI